MEKKIYCISGLGADERVFARIQPPAGYSLSHIRWGSIAKEDLMSSYASRLLVQVQDPHPILLGVSFGGMLAIEMGKLIAARKIFIVSSAKGFAELPDFGILPRMLINAGMIPSGLFTYPARYILERFGAETQEEKNLLAEIIRDSDGKFVKRALRLIANWNNAIRPAGVVHIHGTADRILPLPAGVDHIVKGGTHLMIYNRAAEINNLLDVELKR